MEIEFDPAIFSYEQLLDIYWMQIDPTDAYGQFHDRGESYTTAIFTYTDEQKQIAEASKEKLANSGRFDKPIVTKIRNAERFYPAEDYHQDYYKKRQHTISKTVPFLGEIHSLRSIGKIIKKEGSHKLETPLSMRWQQIY